MDSTYFTQVLREVDSPRQAGPPDGQAQTEADEKELALQLSYSIDQPL